METKNVILWNHEPYYEPPARKAFEVEWSGNLTSATLYLDLDPELPPYYGCATKIVVNGFEYSPRDYGDPCDVMVVDITDAIKQGVNQVEFYYNTLYQVAGTKWGMAYGYVTVQAEEIHKFEPTTPTSLWDVLPWMIGGVFVIGVLGVFAYFISQMPRIPKKKAT